GVALERLDRSALRRKIFAAGARVGHTGHTVDGLRSLSGLLSRMRCTAKKRWMLGARRSAYRAYAQAEQRRRHAFWQQPEGTGRFGRRICQMSVLLALAVHL